MLKGRYKGRSEYHDKDRIRKEPLFPIGEGELRKWLADGARYGLVLGSPGSGKTHLVRNHVKDIKTIYVLDKDRMEYTALDSASDTDVMVIDDVNYAIKAAALKEMKGKKGAVKSTIEALEALDEEARRKDARVLLVSTESLGSLSDLIEEPELKKRFLGRFVDCCYYDDIPVLRSVGIDPPARYNLIHRDLKISEPITRQIDSKHVEYRPDFTRTLIVKSIIGLEKDVRKTFKMRNVPFLVPALWLGYSKKPDYEIVDLDNLDDCRVDRYTGALIGPVTEMFPNLLINGTYLKSHLLPLAGFRQLRIAQERFHEITADRFDMQTSEKGTKPKMWHYSFTGLYCFEELRHGFQTMPGQELCGMGDYRLMAKRALEIGASAIRQGFVEIELKRE
jgi:hypothetical protein